MSAGRINHEGLEEGRKGHEGEFTARTHREDAVDAGRINHEGLEVGRKGIGGGYKVYIGNIGISFAPIPLYPYTPIPLYTYTPKPSAHSFR